MTHPAYLLARLNPKNVRFDVGSGGIPDLLSTDIAGAIAMVPAGLGRELLCRMWWPDGAALTVRDLDDLIRDGQLEEWKSRVEAMVTAQVAVAVAEGGSRDQIHRAGSMLDAARSRMWPRIGPGSCYGDIRVAVLAEMSAASLCRQCDGRGHLRNDAGVVTTCSTCTGGGRIRVSDRHRAAMIGRDESTYRSIWRPVYEWTLQLCQHALEPAERAFSRVTA